MEDLELNILRVLWESQAPVPEESLQQLLDNAQGIGDVLAALAQCDLIERREEAGAVCLSAKIGAEELGVQSVQEHIDTFYGGDLLAFLRAQLDKGRQGAEC